MKVALVHESIAPHRGGAETSLIEMAAALQAQGVAITLVFPQSNQPAADQNDNHIQNFQLLPITIVGGSKYARTRSFIESTPPILAAKQFDIVHAITPLPGADVYQPRGGTYRETILRTNDSIESAFMRPVRAWLRSWNRRQQYLQRVEERWLTSDQPPHVACVSSYVRRQILEIAPALAERTHVIFNGVATTRPSDKERGVLQSQLLDRLQQSENRIANARALIQKIASRVESKEGDSQCIVLFVAHNFRLKGLGPLLRSVAQLPNDFTLIVAGNGKRRQYEKQAAQLGIANRVHFVGSSIPVNEWYAASDLLCHPTWYDPCSRVVLEALQFGLPVVTTQLNGASDAIEPGNNGLVVEKPSQTTELARSIAYARTLKASAAAPIHPINDVSMNRHAKELISLYRRIVESGSK